ncbi:SDR family NAD(P)-dependent oxidoreductase [Lachnoclostridium sp. An118]|uniref:SDR family NAD(P)-dependent oxidoreductase n=1 Tax=Lachnoclostridium sp. An118 TaxID=1965547 RepID=UPI000B36FAC1|nr:SDR family NAD(P)-dependent oxidoreductase [Lachnoclostridium sp. An118]OUQ49102.1 hypothetical protein B5E62_11670 [Lachnoclostridium sp. An118]
MQTWLITGCSGGLGRGTARAALKAGENVAVTGRNTETLREPAGRDKAVEQSEQPYRLQMI